MSKHFVYFHKADLDGHCSGAIVRQSLLKNGIPNGNIVMVPIDHGIKLPHVNDITADDTVHMVDFCATSMEMLRIKKKTPHFYWFDHHISAMNRARSDGFDDLKGKRSDSVAAIHLCWEFYQKSPIPKWVDLLGKYDIWDHSDPDCLPLQYGFRSQETRPENEKGFALWTTLFIIEENNDFEENGYSKVINFLINDGRVILSFEEVRMAKYARAYAHDMVFEGYKTCALNIGHASSLIFKEVRRPDHKLCMTYVFDGNMWKCTISTEDPEIDCSVIAKKFGGGGHRGIAGFACHNFAMGIGMMPL